MKYAKAKLALAVLAINSVAVADELKELETTRVDTENKGKEQVITSLTIEEKMITDADSLVSDIPGVVLRSADSRWGNSGFNIRGVTDDRVAIIVDGLPQGETLQYEGGQAYGYFKGGMAGFDLETMKVVAVTKGADSVISGSGALGGSVRMVTKDADDYLKESGDDVAGQVVGTYTSRNESAGLSLHSAARFGGFEALAILSQEEGHEFENHTAGADIEGRGRERPDPQDRDRTSIFVKLNYDFSDKNTFGVMFQDRQVNTVTDVQSYNGLWYQGRIGDDTDEVKRISVFHKWQPGAALFDQLDWGLSRQYTDTEKLTKQSVTFYGGLTPRIDNRSFDQEVTQFKIDFSKTLGSDIKHELIYGFAYRDGSVDNFQLREQTRAGQPTVNSINQALIPQSDTTAYNFYLLDKIKLSDATEVTAGIRYDNKDYEATTNENFSDNLGNSLGDMSFSSVSGSLGFSHRLNENFRVSAKAGRGFRTPTIEELYTRSGTADNWRTGPNPSLDVEAATNFEVTFGGQFDAGFFSITPFMAQYNDFIESEARVRLNEADEEDTYNVSANVGESDIKGLEIVAGLDLHRALGWSQGWFASFASSSQSGEQKDGDPLTSIQPFNANLGLSYASDSWGLTVRMKHTAGKDADDAYSTASDGSRVEREFLSNTATVFDLVGHMKLTENLTLRGGLYNLGDKEYYTWDGIRFIGPDDLRPGIGVSGSGIKRFTEPGRNFNVRVDYKF